MYFTTTINRFLQIIYNLNRKLRKFNNSSMKCIILQFSDNQGFILNKVNTQMADFFLQL